jgi:hypothetical protein
LLFGQHPNGKTRIGPGTVIMDFDSDYLSLRYSRNNHQVGVRYDNYSTTDLDNLLPLKNNDGSGHAWAAHYRYQYSKHIDFGIEYLNSDKSRSNLIPVTGSANLVQEQVVIGTNMTW